MTGRVLVIEVSLLDILETPLRAAREESVFVASLGGRPRPEVLLREGAPLYQAIYNVLEGMDELDQKVDAVCVRFKPG